MQDHLQTVLIGKKKNKAAINPINKKANKCFQVDVTVALNHEEIKRFTKNDENLTFYK